MLESGVAVTAAHQANQASSHSHCIRRDKDTSSAHAISKTFFLVCCIHSACTHQGHAGLRRQPNTSIVVLRTPRHIHYTYYICLHILYSMYNKASMTTTYTQHIHHNQVQAFRVKGTATAPCYLEATRADKKRIK